MVMHVISSEFRESTAEEREAPSRFSAMCCTDSEGVVYIYCIRLERGEWFIIKEAD